MQQTDANHSVESSRYAPERARVDMINAVIVLTALARRIFGGIHQIKTSSQARAVIQHRYWWIPHNTIVSIPRRRTRSVRKRTPLTFDDFDVAVGCTITWNLATSFGQHFFCGEAAV